MAWIVAISIAVITVVLWLVLAFLRPLIAYLGYEGWDQATLGQWGDTFGALNALFSAFGFSAVVWTLLLQRKQNADVIFENHKQRFESSFFQLLNLLRETRENVQFKYSEQYALQENVTNNKVKKGLSAFHCAWNEALFHIYKEDEPNENAYTFGRIYERQIHKRYESNFGPYFRLVYTILYRIKADLILEEEEKVRYANLLRSQFNSYELALLGLNGLAKVSKDFDDLVTEFRLLKYMPEGTRRKMLQKCYAPEAFLGRD